MSKAAVEDADEAVGECAQGALVGVAGRPPLVVERPGTRAGGEGGEAEIGVAAVRLNRALIDERRVASGLTLQQLADRIGTNRWFLRSSVHDDDVPIGVIVRLAETLDIPVADLLDQDMAEPTPPRNHVRAAAALAETPGLTRSQLARLFGWTRASLRRAEGGSSSASGARGCGSAGVVPRRSGSKPTWEPSAKRSAFA